MKVVFVHLNVPTCVIPPNKIGYTILIFKKYGTGTCISKWFPFLPCFQFLFLISYTQVIILTVLIIHVPTNLAAKTVFSDKKP